MLGPVDTQPCRSERGTSLELSHRDLGDGLCAVSVAGEIDLISAPELKAQLAAIAAEGRSQLILELSGVEHMDSTGLGVLIGINRRLPAGGRLVVAAAPTGVRSLLSLTGLQDAFPAFATVDEAVGHLRGGPARRNPPALSPDAAMVVGLACTALPFAESRRDEVQRWIRILRQHGEAGRALAELGLSDEVRAPLPGDDGGAARLGTITAVTGYAFELAVHRGSPAIGTVDLLLAVMVAYGEDFDRVLRAYGSEALDLIERLGAGPAAASIG